MAEITTSSTVNGESISSTIDYNLGDNINAAIDEYGENAVYQLYIKGATLAVQSKVGAQLRAGKSEDEVQDAMSSWRLDQRSSRVKKSKEDKARQLFEGMDVDQIKATLAGLGNTVK